MADDIKIIIGVDATPVERAVRVMDNLEAEVRKVERAEKAGLITKERAKAEIDRLTASMQKLKVVANGSVSDFNKFEKGLYGSGKAARRNEIAFQQAGYQIQDFIVQVQAGTNPLIAFSQQGSQLAGFFAGPWGAAIGLGIAALGGLGTALLGTKTKTENVHEEFKNLFDYLTEKKETTADLITMSLSGPLEKARRDAIEVLDIFKKIDEEQARQKINQVGLGIVTQVADIQDSLKEERNRKEWNGGRYSFVHGSLAQRQEMFDPLIAEAANLNKAFADALKGPVDGLAMRLNEAFLALKNAGLVTPTLEKDFRDMMEETGLMAQLTKEISDEYEKQKDVIEARNRAEKAAIAAARAASREEARLAAKEAKDYADAINKGLEKRDQFEQKALTALVGKLKAQGNLLAAEKLEVELAREAAVQKVLSTATTLEGKNALVASAIAAADAAEQAVRLGYETDGIKKDARELEKALNASASAMDRMSSSSLNLHVQIAQAKAEAAALAAGLDVSVARNTAKARETYQAQYLEASGAAQMAGDLDAMEQAQRIYNEQLQGLKELDTLMQSNAATKESQKGSSRTTDPIKSGTEYIERVLKPEIDLRKKSAFMSDEQRKRAEFEFELQQKTDKYKKKASEKEIQAAMTLYDQAVRLERVGDIIDYSQGQFENFFMTVVDGTASIEDAFKGMLRNILLEIYKQQVAKPAAEGIGNLLRKGAMAIFGGGQTTASAYGNVFQNGSVKAFADGGIVSGPTFFPMSNGTGLMGEAGPEAIMPLKRGPNGKLGVEASGGQQVVVNQSFNFAANGDESVKKIIAQAAPQIAQMTQKQIMDSRRRGGQMKAAFS